MKKVLIYVIAGLLMCVTGCNCSKFHQPQIPPCSCGCMKTGDCKCKNCCERTADPTWKPEQSK